MHNKIVAAAIFLDGFVAVALPKERHHNIINNLAETGFPTPIGGVQGFLTSEGIFVDRKMAMIMARANNQLIPREGQHGVGGDLFSEDLW